MDIKIGIQNVAREVTLESNQTADEVLGLINAAIAEGGVLDLADDKGRRVIVPGSQIGYVELGAENQRRVGFGVL